MDLKTLQLPEQNPNRFKQAKSFTFARPMEIFGDEDPLAVDSFVDAKDSVNNWCVALVKKINHEDKSVRVSFEGWSYKYDTDIRKASIKIAPFRTHTFGYTGQPKTAYRDFKLQ